MIANKNDYKETVLDSYSWNTYFYYSKIDDMLEICSIGCELSQFDCEYVSGLLKGKLKQSTIVVNVCAVTESSFVAGIELCKLLKELYKSTQLFIIGCGIEYGKSKFKDFGICLTNKEKYKAKSYGVEENDVISFGTCSKNNELTSESRAFVKIQDGCPNKCAYCIVNKTRGKPYSVSYDKIKQQIENRLSNGFNTVELVGTEITFYDNNGMKLSDLCKCIIDDFPNLKKLRLNALDPASKEIEKIIDLIKKYPDRFSKDICLAAQSCCNSTLYNMKRHHDFDRLKFISDYGKGIINLSCQIITGFPRESEKDFNDSFNKIKLLNLTDVSPTAFSRRKGTEGYKVDNQIPFSHRLKRKEQIEKYRKEMNGREEQEKKERYELKKKLFQIKKECDFKCNFSSIRDISKMIMFLENFYTESIDNFVCLNTNNKLSIKSEVFCKFLVKKYGLKILNEFQLTPRLINRIITKKFDLVDYCTYGSRYVSFKVNSAIDNKYINDLYNFFVTSGAYDSVLFKNTQGMITHD